MFRATEIAVNVLYYGGWLVIFFGMFVLAVFAPKPKRASEREKTEK